MGKEKKGMLPGSWIDGGCRVAWRDFVNPPVLPVDDAPVLRPLSKILRQVMFSRRLHSEAFIRFKPVSTVLIACAYSHDELEGQSDLEVTTPQGFCCRLSEKIMGAVVKWQPSAFPPAYLTSITPSGSSESLRELNINSLDKKGRVMRQGHLARRQYSQARNLDLPALR